MTEDIEPGAPLIGRMTFDMQKARDLAAHPIHCAETDEMFRAALVEIERLQKDNANLLDALLGGGARIIINNAEQAKRIAELEEEIRGLVRCILTDDEKDVFISKQRAALKKLGQTKRERGKALVEARRLLATRYATDYNSPRWEELEKEVRQQLRQEGLL